MFLVFLLFFMNHEWIAPIKVFSLAITSPTAILAKRRRPAQRTQNENVSFNTSSSRGKLLTNPRVFPLYCTHACNTYKIQ